MKAEDPEGHARPPSIYEHERVLIFHRRWLRCQVALEAAILAWTPEADQYDHRPVMPVKHGRVLEVLLVGGHPITADFVGVGTPLRRPLASGPVKGYGVEAMRRLVAKLNVVDWARGRAALPTSERGVQLLGNLTRRQCNLP